MPNADIEALIRLNTLSPIVLTKYVVRGMMAEGGGRIVNMSSIVAATGFNGLSVYARHQGVAGRLHALAGARGRPARHHRQRDRAGLHRHRNDRRSRRRRPRAHRRAAARCAGWPRPTTSPAMAALLMGEGGRNITGTVLTVDAGATA